MRYLPWLLLWVLLCSCASVSVKRTELLTPRAPKRIPERILVKPPTFYAPNLLVDRSGASLENLKNELQEKFLRNLVRRLSTHIAPAYAIAATAPLPRRNDWLIIARFDRVNQGSRLLRSVVGFGAGGTKVEMSVLVYDLSKPKPGPFLLIQTTGGSNAMPGAVGTAAYVITGVTALFSVGNLFEGARSGLSFDVIRTTHEITASLSEFLFRQGGLAPEQVLHPRRLRNSTPAWQSF
jgi:hypothetical protein